MHQITSLDCSRIAQDLQIRKVQVESVAGLLDEGNTVPFITRYRKERTGGLNEDVIRQIQTRVHFVRQLADRKQTILKSIEGQGKLTEDLRQAILKADTVKRLEDLYLPYKPKKRSQATKAREQGLEPLAQAIWHSDAAAANLDELLPSLVNPEKELTTVEEVRAGVQHILAEMTAETAAVRAIVRSLLWETGKICAARNEKMPEGHGQEYKDYFEFSEAARQIPPHRILALNRGEKEQALKIRLEWHADAVRDNALKALADHLLHEVGRAPAASQQTGAGGQESGDRGQESGVGSQEPGESGQVASASQDSLPSAESVAAESVAQVGVEQTAPASEPAAAPVAETSAPPSALPGPEAAPNPPSASVPEATPLVASLPTEPRTPLAGEPLVAGMPFTSPHAGFLRSVLDDSLARLLLPSLEREIRRELTDEAEGHAVAVFARNLRSLLLQPPLRGKRILAVDPGFRTGCKVAALDEYGNLLEHVVIYPHGGKKVRDKPAKPAEIATSPGADQVGADAGSGTPALASGTPASAAPAVAPVEGAPQETISPAVEALTAPPVAEAAAVAPQGALSSSPEDATPAPAVAETPPQTLPPATVDTVDASSPQAPSGETTSNAAPSGETTSGPSSASAAPAPAQSAADKRAEAKDTLHELVTKHQLQVAALGNGTGCRETEELIADLIASSTPDLAYVIVNEAGASVYSVSPVGREEFPEFDATLRSTISIGRRLQDPLSELVKVDPQSIGVGLYQHDMGRKELKESLDAVVESCVNQVGVDLNTASVPLLRHVSGLNQLVARELIDYRKQQGPFSTREALLQIPGLGPARYVQAAGFLKIPGGANPLDRTWIHPESYPVAEQILLELGYSPAVLDDRSAQEEFQLKLKAVNVEDVAKRLNVGIPTVADILQSLARPGRDPREDLPPPIFKKGILKLEDLQPGMELKGTVLNVVDFGAFVDIGLKDSGLVHISQMANRYIKSPYDVVAVSDVVTVWVMTVDHERHRVSLTMIKPGTERKPPERGPRPRQEGSRPPRSRRSGPPQGQGEGQVAAQEAGQGRPPRGRGPGRRGPGGPPQRSPAAAGSEGVAAATGGGTAPAGRHGPPPRPAPPPRKPRREPPKPKLSQDALEGKVPLRTFGELSALFAAKKEPEKKAPPPAAPTPPAPSAPPAPPAVQDDTPAAPSAQPSPPADEGTSGATS